MDVRGIHPSPNHLEGDLLLELAVGALREVHHAHPAVRQLAEHAVWADHRLAHR
jgi:hypothetical protein